MQWAELNLCYSGRQKLGPSSGDALSDSSHTLLPVHGKVTLTCQNSFQLQLHLTQCSLAPARVHSPALLSKACLPWAMSLHRTLCALLDRMYWGQCAGAWSGHKLLFDSALGSWLQQLEMFLRLLSFVAVNVFMSATQWSQPIGDPVDSAHHFQAKMWLPSCGSHRAGSSDEFQMLPRCCPRSNQLWKK